VAYVFEWDLAKATENARKHGVTTRQRLLVVAFAERPPRTRLVSARQATRQERRRYETTG
jgi:uncharacterized DUF497 family protein